MKETNQTRPAYSDRERGLFLEFMVKLYEFGDLFYEALSNLQERRLAAYIIHMNLTKSVGPSALGLAESFGVPKETMRRTISSMVDRGILERRSGRQLFYVISDEKRATFADGIDELLRVAKLYESGNFKD